MHILSLCSLLSFGVGSLWAVQIVAPDGYGNRVESLAKDVISVRSIDIQDADFADLLPIKKKIGNARIVQLGEQSHQDGATFLAKQRLVRFLHEEMGFNILAWESGLSDAEELNDLLASSERIRSGSRPASKWLWNDSGLLTPLWEYARTSLQSRHPFRQTGFDIQFADYPQDCIFKQIDAIDPRLLSPEERAFIDELSKKVLAPSYKPEPGVHEARRAAMDRLLDRLRLGVNRSKHPREQEYLVKLLENIWASAEFFKGWRIGREAAGPDASTASFRDVKMGENLVWLAQRRYRDEKIIVWSASFHVARNLSAISTRPDFHQYVTMGDIVTQKLGRKVYTIAFSADQGKIGNRFRPPKPVSGSSPVSIEAALHQLGKPYAFVDLRHLRSDDWRRRPFVARPFGYEELPANWPEIVDALFYTDTMFPDVLSEVPPKSAGDVH